MFALIEDGHVVLCKGGVFRPAKVYVRNKYLYAGYAGGFIRLGKHDRGTSAKDVLYEELFLPFTPTADSIGRLMQP